MARAKEEDRKALLNDVKLRAHFDIICKQFENNNAPYNESLIFELAENNYNQYKKIEKLEKKATYTFDPDITIGPSVEFCIDVQDISFLIMNGKIDIKALIGKIELNEIRTLQEQDSYKIPYHNNVKVFIEAYADEVKITQELEK